MQYHWNKRSNGLALGWVSGKVLEDISGEVGQCD
jgi:hypothetical protein